MKYNKSNIKNLLLIFVISLVIIEVAFFLSSFIVDSSCLYKHVKKAKRGWNGGVYQGDPQLGFKPRPNSSGEELTPLEKPINVRFDKYGFRIPFNRKELMYTKKPLILFLGCSFTYGAVCEAEQTFPYLVSEYLDCSTINAGVCAYGLTHMSILACKLMPHFKPDFVVVQYSPWLSSRSKQLYKMTFNSKMYNPYVAEKANELYVVYPSVSSPVFNFAIYKFREKGKGLIDFIYFTLKYYVPFYILEKMNGLIVNARLFLNLMPYPHQDEREVELFLLNKIYKACKENNTKMMLLILGGGLRKEPKRLEEFLREKNDVVIVNVDNALWEGIGSESEYYEEYGHWKDYYIESERYALMVDEHPNPLAHRIIAKSIYKSFKK